MAKDSRVEVGKYSILRTLEPKMLERRWWEIDRSINFLLFVAKNQEANEYKLGMGLLDNEVFD